MSDSYRDLLARADEHFASVVAAQPANLQCRAGCTLCCHGLFEIGAADVVVIADGIARLDAPSRARVVARAHEAIAATEHPDLREAGEEEKEAFFSRADSIPCPALDDAGRCSIYESRPLVCRTFGLPLRDGARLLGEVCELNFNEATPAQTEAAAWDLQWEDVLGVEDQYTVAEAIVLAERMGRSEE